MTTMSADHGGQEPPGSPPASEILARAGGLDRHSRWGELVNAGERLLSAGRSDDARTVLEALVAEIRPVVARESDRQAPLALSAGLVNLALVEIGRGSNVDLRRGEELLDEAERLVGPLELGERLGTIEINRARIASLRGENGAARSALDRAEQHYRSAGALHDLAWVKRALGASLAAAGQLEEALVAQIQAQELFRGRGDELQADMAEIGIVAIRTQLGQSPDADERQRLERLSERLPAEAAIQLLGNLANVAFGDDLDRAERLWTAARERALDASREVDQARADLAIAGVTRRRGQLHEALAQTVRAGERLGQLGAWEAAARAEVNAALLLALIADAADAGSTEPLRAQAVGHVRLGLAALDRFRHSLPSPAARRDLLRNRYPQLFVAALDAATEAGDSDFAAALIERARVQPVLAARRVDDEGYAEPPQLAARPGSDPIDGRPPRVDLTAAAGRLAGPGAWWLGWWLGERDLLRSAVAVDHTKISAAEIPQAARTQLDKCLARVSPEEALTAETDATLPGRLTLARCAHRPLLADPDLAQRILATLPADTRLDAETRLDLDPTTLDDILWPLSDNLFGERFLQDLARHPVPPAKLVVAPPPQFADLPWPLLPLRPPRAEEDPASVPRLLDVAEIVVGLPAALVSDVSQRDQGRGAVAVLDPIGDLPFARGLNLDGRRLGHGQAQAATPANVIDAIADAGLLIVSAHVQPGSGEQPAAASIVLSDGHGGAANLSVAQLAEVTAPSVCMILGCDGSGGTVADEWTGLATGLLWAGAQWIITSTWPTIEDRHTAAADTRLVSSIARFGPQAGMWTWQRDQLDGWRRNPRDRSFAPYRWAGTILCGRGSPAS